MSFKWIERLVGQEESISDEDRSAELNRAVAVLMLEVAQSDFFESEEETTALLASLSEHIQAGKQTADELLAAARTDKSNSAGLYQFTRLACTEMSIEERCSLVEQLWQIAFADGVIDKYEEAAIRKMSDLLYVPHGEFIKAKLRAEKMAEKTT